MRRTDSLEECLMLGKIEGGRRRGWDGWMASPTPWTRVWASSESSEEQGSLARCSPWGRKESDTTEPLNWTELHCNHRILGISWAKILVLKGEKYLKNKDQINDFTPRSYILVVVGELTGKPYSSEFCLTFVITKYKYKTFQYWLILTSRESLKSCLFYAL